ncbi:CAAT box DNA-binding protein subunit B [Aphelenchoides bicaudatus]|nr:CAAT box DNA-binding protein subunit B [Aphelenchoides bicaudatus]
MANGESSTEVDVIQEQDRFLPIANVARIMKRVVPSSGKLSKESKECVQECVTEFIQFIVAEASERCSTEKRKTITCEDLLQALSTLGFDPYVEVLKTYIEKYRSAVKNIQPSENNNPPTNSSKPEQQPPSNEPETSEQSALQPVQMFVDSNSGQHYIQILSADGSNALVPVNLTSNSES